MLDPVFPRAEALQHSLISKLGVCKGFVLVFWGKGLLLILRWTCPKGVTPAGHRAALASTWWCCFPHWGWSVLVSENSSPPILQRAELGIPRSSIKLWRWATTPWLSSDPHLHPVSELLPARWCSTSFLSQVWLGFKTPNFRDRPPP